MPYRKTSGSEAAVLLGKLPQGVKKTPASDPQNKAVI